MNKEADFYAALTIAAQYFRAGDIEMTHDALAMALATDPHKYERFSKLAKFMSEGQKADA